jgi:phage gp29-like protein
MWSDIMDIQDVLTDQYVAVDYMLNYGEPTNGQLPRFSFITDEAEDFQANASIISQMSSAGFEPEDLAEASRKVGYQLKKTEGTPFNLPIPE